MADNQTAPPAQADSGRPKRREDILGDDDYFMAVALLSAQRSRDPSTQVGACIVNQENKIVGIGYNGMPNGCDDEKLPWDRSNRQRRTLEPDDKSETKHAYVCHAELNAIMNKYSADVKDCTIYVSLFPCNECAKVILQAGIKKVVYMSDKYKDRWETKASKRMFNMAGVVQRQFRPRNVKISIDFNSTD